MRFDDLVRQHAADLYRYAFWLARDRSRPEDIVQEALLRGWRAYPRLRAQAAAKSWLFSIAHNEYLRAAKADAHWPEDQEVEIADERQTELGLEMREALMALPASYAEPLALQVLGGFSCAEIAAMLGTTEGATMTRLTRARQALRRLIAPVKERRGGRA
ncbi:MAG TPA: sigma-70 family RNA polymerase sigma factor [Burkholderiales bacterium]|nr:sigma-70 family RNA polymerase sigma factor [Burkholderiales bacterium]